MKRRISAWSTVATGAAVAAWLLSVPASAADQKGGSSGGGQTSSSSGGSGGHASGSSGGGGGHASSGGGGGHASGGGGGHVSGGGGARSGEGSRSASGGSRSSGGTAVARGSGSGASSTTNGNAGDRAAYRGDSGHSKAAADPVPPYSRPRDGKPSVGTAVPRTGVPPSGGGTVIYVPGGYFGGYYPWAFGGLGFGSYYGGFYDPCYSPYDMSGFGCGGFGYGGGYGAGYGGGYGESDPQTYGSSSPEEGAIHLKIKPRDAAVYVDGYYVGVVDDFDGIFQKLHVEPGAHRVEVRAPGYETLVIDVRVEPGKSTTYKGELKKIQ